MKSDFQCFDKAIDLLAVDKLAAFDTSLQDLSDTNKNKQRILYLHNAIEPIGPGRSFMESLESLGPLEGQTSTYNLVKIVTLSYFDGNANKHNIDSVLKGVSRCSHLN